jgi:cytochrome c oxidase subunit 2
MNWFSNSTEAVDTAFHVLLAVSLTMLVLVTTLMVGFAVKYHRKRHPTAEQVKGNTLLEIVWTVIPTLLALGMFYIGWTGYKVMRRPPDNALQVSATGRMWSWEFKYGNGKSSTELYVPQGVPVKVNLKSADVIHSFYIPAYRVKQDVVPGMETYTWFQPVDTGRYDIFCAEYCGQRHAYMRSKVVVVPPDEFKRWLETDVEPAALPASGTGTEEDRLAQLRKAGERLSSIKGCVACHSTDGSRLVGPSYKGLFGKTETVVTDGRPRQVVVDDEYVRRSIAEPAADIVEGYQPVMPKLELTEEEITAIVEYLKTL